MAKEGRPTVMTKETLQKLEEAFLSAATDEQACFIAGIAPATLYAYCVDHPEFSERKEQLKNMATFQAKHNLVKAINKGDKAISQWWAERKARSEFATKVENEHSGEIKIETVNYADTAPLQSEEVPTTTP